MFTLSVDIECPHGKGTLSVDIECPHGMHCTVDSLGDCIGLLATCTYWTSIHAEN